MKNEIAEYLNPEEKDKKTKELIEKAHEEAIDLINRQNWYKFWNWFKPRETRRRKKILILSLIIQKEIKNGKTYVQAQVLETRY